MKEKIEKRIDWMLNHLGILGSTFICSLMGMFIAMLFIFFVAEGFGHLAKTFSQSFICGLIWATMITIYAFFLLKAKGEKND